MAMKLISPLQNKDKQQEETVRKLLRIQEIEELYQETNSKLAQAQVDFNTSLAKNQEKWLLEEENHQRMIRERTEELNKLENRKKQALIPVSMYKLEADKIMSEAQEIIQMAKEKEEIATDLQERLEEKLTELSDREQILKDNEQRIEIAKQGIETQKTQTKQGTQKLFEEMTAFNEYKKIEESDLEERKKDVHMAEVNINAKINKFKRDFDSLKDFEVRLKDERATLDREYARKNK